MRPLKISFQAFASYVEKTEIDFTKLDRIFLINGETGAGKTAILDAMMYALYGRSSGGERSRMRCAFPKAADIPTEVDLIFENRGEKYRFTRSLCPTNSKKQPLKLQQNCYLFDKEKNIFVPFFDNPHADDVEKKAEEITGLTAEQFRQVVILPQGRFERLLTSDSKDKETILSTLFGMEKYALLSDKLAEAALEERRQLDAEEAALNTMLDSANVQDREGLAAETEKLSALSEELARRLEEAAKELSLSRKKLTDSEILYRSFSDLAAAKEKLAALDEQTGHIENIRLLLDLHEKAVRARPEYIALTEAEKALDTRRSALSSAEKAYSAAESKNALLIKKKDSMAALEKDISGKSVQLTVLNGLSENYDKAADAEKKLSLLSEEYAEHEKRRADTENALDRTVRDLNDSSEKRSRIVSEYSEKLPLLLAQKTALETGRKKYMDLHLYETELKKIRDEITGLERQTETAGKEAAAAEAEYDRLYTVYIGNIAAELSSELKEGTPCPVCGSLSHPAPAKDPVGAVTSAQVKDARAKFENISSAISKIKERIACQSARIPAAEQCIADCRKVIQETNYTAEGLALAEQQYEEARRQNDLLPGLNKHIATLTAQKEELEAGLKSISAKVNETALQKAAKENELSVLRENLAADCPDRASYELRVNMLKTEIDSLSAQKKQYDAALAASEKDLTAAGAVLGQAREEFSAAENRAAAAGKAFSDKIVSLGISSAEQYKDSLLADEKAAAYLNEKELYDRQRHAVTETIGQLSGKLTGQTVPELDAIREAVSAAEKLYGDISSERAVCAEQLQRLKKLEQEYTARRLKYDNSVIMNDKRKAFAKFMRGDKGISFSRYVLGIMLKLVTAEANRILSGIHGGMFRLCVKSDIAHNAKQGLDLEVENTAVPSSGNTAVKYGVKDLSGGEKFIISLALSLGLSAVAQSRSGGISIEAMFIDEGFGSLDTDSLREAIGVLCEVSQERSIIGIISHVEELISVIPSTLKVERSAANGSAIII